MAKRKGLYKTNKKAKVGETIECPICHAKFTKKNNIHKLFAAQDVRIDSGMQRETDTYMQTIPTMILEIEKWMKCSVLPNIMLNKK